MIVLSIDPALRNTGYAVVEWLGPRKFQTHTWGVISNPKSLKPSECLVRIHEQLSQIIHQHHPTECAVEGVIFVQSHRTAITLGAARGAALLAAAQAKIPIVEYAPRRVKQAIVGKGAADKSQVAFMVRALLGLRETPPSDAADALAIALTHCSARERPLALEDQPTEI